MKFGFNLTPQQSVYAAFTLVGISFGSIFTRLGDIQLSMNAGQTALGGALIGTAAGMMLSVTLLSPYFERVGFRRVFLAAVPLIGLFTVFASLAPNPTVMFLCLVGLGVSAGAASTVINVEADRTEYLVGHRIMNRCHSLYSVGFLATALVGAAARQIAISPFWHLLGIAIFLLVFTTLSWNGYAPAPTRPADGQKTPTFAMPTRAVLLVGAFTLAGMICEGAASDWSVIYMRDVFQSEPFIGGLALALSSTAQAATRFWSDRFVDRYGPIAIARFMLLILALGTLAVTASPSWIVALAGFALMGAGNAVIMPLAISSVARLTDRPAAINVAALTQLSWIAFFAGPPLLGGLAEHVHVRLTFGAVLPLIVLSFVLAPFVLRERLTDETKAIGA